MKKIFTILFVVISVFALATPTVIAQDCEGNFDCDQDVDGSDAFTFKEDFGRSTLGNPCPPCNPCPYSMVDCGTKCVEPDSDREYCGVNEECLGGTVCGDGEICEGGACVLSCQTGLTNCSGMCVDTETDKNHCGSCGIGCGVSEICVTGMCGSSYPAPVAKTGQTTAHSTWDDGYLQKGVPWPNPRFTDNLDGTVRDNLTGLIWLKDANCFGERNWYQALEDSNGLENGECGLTDSSSAGDWRLPNRNELSSLVKAENFNPALSDTAGTGIWTEGDPFTNIESSHFYWSSSGGSSDLVWGLYIMDGSVSSVNMFAAGPNQVWPVRGGQ